MINADIFIRTYKGDLKWLSYCLEAIQRFDRGFNKIIVCIPQDQSYLLQNLTEQKLVTTKIYEKDYIGQQIDKLQAFKYSDADYIMMLDSDTIFTEDFSPEDYIIDGKPVIIRESYFSDSLKKSDAFMWKGITERYIGESVNYEYMRRHPFIFRRDTLVHLNTHFPFTEEPKELSEFNLLGAYCAKYEPSHYHFMEVGKDDIPASKLKQFWSWGGLSKEIEEEIKKLIR